MQQLHMVHSDPASVSAPIVPPGIVLRTFTPGDELAWAQVVNLTDLGRDYDASKVRGSLSERPVFDPEGLFLACAAATGQPLATACAWWQTRVGKLRPMLHMVAARPDAAGRGLGKLVCQAVLHYHGQRGQREVLLSTDEHRLAAISVYLRLGFRPMRYFGGEDHEPRWNEVLSRLSGKCGHVAFAGTGQPITVGVLGLGRGGGLAELIAAHPAGRIAAGADRLPELRERFAARHAGAWVDEDLESLLQTPAEAILVANDCPDHAPAAVRALQAGRAVLSEVTAFHTPAEGVELLETVQETHRPYMLAENHIYSSVMLELWHLAACGTLGSMQYGECEYLHDIRALMTRDGEMHWRGWLPPIYYTTHSLGPVLRTAALAQTLPRSDSARQLQPRCRATRLVGLNSDVRIGGDQGGISLQSMLLQLNTGGLVRASAGFALSREPASLFAAYFGRDASFETDRWGELVHLFDPRNRQAISATSYRPTGRDECPPSAHGHGGSDARMVEYWLESLANGLEMPIDVYEAADMTMPGILAHRSCVRGGQPVEVPDLRSPAARDLWRGDNRRVDPADPRRLME